MESDLPQDACPTCDSTSDLRTRCSYKSHLKIFEGCSNRGTWSVGSDKILKEKPFEPTKCELISHQFVKDNTQIPIATVLSDWVDDNNQNFTILERVKGQTLEKAWPSLSTSDKERIAEDVVQCLQQLRKFQSPRMEGTDNKRLHTYWFFFQGHETTHGPYGSETEIWNVFETILAKVPKEIIDKLKTRLPCMTPFTFTHCDINSTNIMVHEGRLSAILDWEHAGYFPVWWEYSAAGIGYGADDLEWKKMVQAKMTDQHPEAREVWRCLYALRNYPDIAEGDQERITELMKDAE